MAPFIPSAGGNEACAGNAVLVVGDAMTDIIVKPEGPLVRGSDRRATIRGCPGGSGANQAAWLGHFGVAVRFAAKVGRADLAAYEAMMRGSGVVPKISCDEARPTGMLVTIVDPDGQRSFLTDRGANEALDAADLPDELLEDIALLHVSGYAFFSPRPRVAALDLMHRARRRGILISVDPSSVSFLEEVGPAAFLDWTAGAAICFPNEEEAALLSGTDDHEHQRVFLARHYRTVAIKRGWRGGEVVGPQGELLAALPAPRIEVVDSTGAGDAFLAAYLAAHIRSEGVLACLRSGIAAGSSATEVMGGRPSATAPARDLAADNVTPPPAERRLRCDPEAAPG